MRIRVSDCCVHNPYGNEPASFIFRPSLEDLLKELGTYKVDCTTCMHNGKNPGEVCDNCLWATKRVSYYKAKK